MDDIKYFSGKIVLKENSEKVFVGISFKDVEVESNNSSMIFNNCIFYNDFKLDNAKEVIFQKCIFLLNSAQKCVSVNVNALNVRLDNVVINDICSNNSIVKFNCDSLNGDDIYFSTLNDKNDISNSCFDVVYSNKCRVDNSLICANEHYYKISKPKIKILD